MYENSSLLFPLLSSFYSERLFLSFLFFLYGIELWFVRERERDRESTPFPFWIFPLLFPSTKQNLFFFLFFLFPFSNTPSQRRAAQERDPFSLLSFPLLSFPFLSSLSLFILCVCVLIWTQKQCSLTTYLCYLSFPNHPPIFAHLFPFLSLPNTVLIGGGVVLCFGLGLNHHESKLNTHRRRLWLLGNPTDPDPFAFDYLGIF